MERIIKKTNKVEQFNTNATVLRNSNFFENTNYRLVLSHVLYKMGQEGAWASTNIEKF